MYIPTTVINFAYFIQQIFKAVLCLVANVHSCLRCQNWTNQKLCLNRLSEFLILLWNFNKKQPTIQSMLPSMIILYYIAVCRHICCSLYKKSWYYTLCVCCYCIYVWFIIPFICILFYSCQFVCTIWCLLLTSIFGRSVWLSWHQIVWKWSHCVQLYTSFNLSTQNGGLLKFMS